MTLYVDFIVFYDGQRGTFYAKFEFSILLTGFLGTTVGGEVRSFSIFVKMRCEHKHASRFLHYRWHKCDN